MANIKWQCFECGSQSSLSKPSISGCIVSSNHNWEHMGEPSNVKWFWRCRFCGNVPPASSPYPGTETCFARGKINNHSLNHVWVRLIPDNFKYDGNNWECQKCRKTAKYLKVDQADSKYNVPKLAQCIDNKLHFHIWKKIK